MAEETTNPLVESLFNLANTFATPLAKKLAETTPSSGAVAAKQTLNESVDWAKLNGSGPNDTSLARAQAPLTLADFISGQSNATKAVSSQSNIILWGAIGVLGLFLLLKLSKTV